MRKLLALGIPLSLLLLFPLASPGVAVDDDEGVLHEAMEGLNERVRALGKAVGSAEGRGDALRLVAEMEALVLTAKLEQPTNIDTLEEADRPAHVVGFRKELCGLAITLLELETALLDGDDDAAREMLKRLNEHKRDGHAKYQPKDK